MNLIYYYHIPKCAGTFISQNLIMNVDKKVYQERIKEELEWMETPYDNPINPERNILYPSGDFLPIANVGYIAPPVI